MDKQQRKASVGCGGDGNSGSPASPKPTRTNHGGEIGSGSSSHRTRSPRRLTHAEARRRESALATLATTLQRSATDTVAQQQQQKRRQQAFFNRGRVGEALFQDEDEDDSDTEGGSGRRGSSDLELFHVLAQQSRQPKEGEQNRGDIGAFSSSPATATATAAAVANYPSQQAKLDSVTSSPSSNKKTKAKEESDEVTIQDNAAPAASETLKERPPRVFRGISADGSEADLLNDVLVKRSCMGNGSDYTATGNGLEERASSTTSIPQYSRHSKKRIEGPVQPGAFGASPGQIPSRNDSLRYSSLNTSFHVDSSNNSHTTRTHTSAAEEEQQQQTRAPSSSSWPTPYHSSSSSPPVGARYSLTDMDFSCKSQIPAEKRGGSADPMDISSKDYLQRKRSSSSGDLFREEEDSAPMMMEMATMTIDPRNEGLVEAKAIQESAPQILAEADEYDPELQPGSERQTEIQQKSSKTLKRTYAFMCLLVVGIALIILGATGVFSRGTTTIVLTSAPSIAPTNSPTAAPTPFLVPLPDYTIEAIETNPNSPQFKAYQWIREDPNLESYTENQRLQKYALATFYYASGGGGASTWTLDTNWLSYEIDECDWHSKNLAGACDENGNYMALVLTKNGLIGSLPPELSLLSHLEIIDLASNSIGGKIPTQISLLPQMKELVLDVNQLTGQVPSEIAQLSLLEYFYVHTNPQLTGTMPSELGLMNRMIDLQWGKTSVNGTIPSQLGLLTRMTHLYLSENLLRGTIPSEIYRLTSISGALALDRNHLSGRIQTDIGLMRKMKNLFLQEAGLSGIIPTELGLLPDLQKVFLHGNRFSGSLPSQMGQLSVLEHLLFSNNTLTGSLPTSLGLLGNLTFLLGKQNRLGHQLPTQLGKLSALEHLLLSDNLFNLGIPSELGLLGNMKQLVLNSNQLTSSIPPELGGLTKLEGLYVNINSLTGTIPSEVGSLQNLQTFYFDINKLNGTLPSEVGRLQQLRHLLGNHNQITALPKELGLLTNLWRLNLGSNRMTSSIPHNLFADLGQLAYLELANNPLNGPLPSELSGMKNLAHLILEGTNLSGTLPTTIGSLSSMVLLSLSSTNISGTIPSEIRQLHQLEWLTLQNTNISGEIPQELPPTLTTFGVSNTSVSGTMPVSVCNAPVLLFDCSESLCGCSCAC